MAASPINEPISIISGKILCVQPFNLLTPMTVKRLEPIPLIFAPILFSILHNCCKYGSQAALYILVVPSQSTEAIKILAVPVTEASSKRISSPFIFEALIL